MHQRFQISCRALVGRPGWVGDVERWWILTILIFCRSYNVTTTSHGIIHNIERRLRRRCLGIIIHFFVFVLRRECSIHMIHINTFVFLFSTLFLSSTAIYSSRAFPLDFVFCRPPSGSSLQSEQRASSRSQEYSSWAETTERRWLVYIVSSSDAITCSCMRNTHLFAINLEFCCLPYNLAPSCSLITLYYCVPYCCMYTSSLLLGSLTLTHSRRLLHTFMIPY